VSAKRTADRSLEEVRPPSVLLPRQKSAPVAFGWRSRSCGFPRRSSIGCGSMAFTAPLLSFTVSGATPGFPDRGMPARFRAGIRPLTFTSRSARPARRPRLLCSRPADEPGERGGPVVSDPRERVPLDPTPPCLPRTRSFEAPFSGIPRRSTPGASLAEQREAAKLKIALSGRGCQPTASRSVRVVLHHLDGLLRTAGLGLVASRYRTWGSLRFTTAKRRPPERSRRAAGQPVPEGDGIDPDPRSANPSKVSSSSAAVPHRCGRCPPVVPPRPPRQRPGHLRVPGHCQGEWATGFRRAPGGRGLTAVPSGCSSTAREPCGNPSDERLSWMW
jgi:hypothetical protein